jgi:hypothetical protein
MGTIFGPSAAVFQQAAQHAHKGHGGAHLLAVGGQRELGVGGQGRDVHDVGRRFTPRQIAAQRRAFGVHVLHLGAVGRGFVEGQVFGLLVRQRQVKAVAEFDQVFAVEFFLRMRGHLALAGAAHAVAFFGVRQDHGGLALVVGRRGISGVDLHQVVAAAFEAVDLLVRHALGQAREFFALAEEVVAVKAPVFGGKGLHLAVHRLRKRLRQGARQVARKEAVPVAAPDQFDDVPAGAGKQLFELVDDAAVAAHRAVQALQVAVDDPDHVVQPFARGQRQRAHGFGLVHLAVAEHAPDLAARAVEQTAVREVAHEARVVDRADRAYAHGAGRELPEVRHQIRVRIAAQALRALAGRGEFLAVKAQVFFVEAAFQVGACIHAGRAVRLKEHQVAAVLAFRHAFTCAKEMVEAGFKQVGRAGVAGDVAAKLGRAAGLGLVGAYHHGQRVPAHQRGQALFHRQVAGEHGLLVDADGVDVRRRQFGLPADALLAGDAAQVHAASRRARAGPCVRARASNASRHSAVSCGSGSVGEAACISKWWGVESFMAGLWQTTVRRFARKV